MGEPRSTLDRVEPPLPVEVLGQAALALHGPGGIDEKLPWVAEAAASLTGAAVAAFIGLGNNSAMAAVDGAPLAEVERFARPAIARVLTRVRPRDGRRSTSRPHWDVLRPADLAGDRRYRLFLQRVGLSADGCCLVVPVRGEQEALHGALVVCHGDPTSFGPEHETALVSLAAHLGVALENLETMNRLAELQALQREVVHQLQEAVRPPVPSVEETELGVHYLPADPSSPTGGDLYDWLVLPDGDLHLAVVDVMGKGVPATQAALAVIHAVRLLVLDRCPMPDVVARADYLCQAQNPELIATVLVARYRPADGTVELAGGGHPPALVLRGGDTVELVSAPGVPVGFPGAGTSRVVRATLGRNDTLVLYTDGLIEANKDILLGLRRLEAAAAETAGYPAGHLARALVDRSLAGAVRRDDSLAVVLRRRTPPGPEPSLPPLGTFEYRFSPIPATIPLGRHLLADWLEHLDVDDGERADLLLMASELCSNGIRHASGTPGGLVLRAWAEGASVVVEVEDDGAGFEIAERYDDEMPDVEAEQGRGLFVVEALSDEMTVRRVDDRTYVRVVRRAVLPGRMV